MEEVCAIPLNPPKAVEVIATIYLIRIVKSVSARQLIPLVISRQFSSKSAAGFGIGRFSTIEIKMEKSIIYPPILMSVSKPFIMAASMILKFICDLDADFSCPFFTCSFGKRIMPRNSAGPYKIRRLIPNIPDSCNCCNRI